VMVCLNIILEYSHKRECSDLYKLIRHINEDHMLNVLQNRALKKIVLGLRGRRQQEVGENYTGMNFMI
jgi:hypothetical protein